MIDEDSQPALPLAQQPHCFPNKHLTVDEHGFYSVCFAMAHASKGRIDFASRRFAKLFAGNAEGGRMGKSKAAELAQQLQIKGWFVLLKPSVKDPETGQKTPTTYRVLSHAQWTEKHPHDCQKIADALPPDTSVTVGNVPSPRLRTGDNRAIHVGGGTDDFDSPQPSIESTVELESSPQVRTGSNVPVHGRGQAERFKSEKTSSFEGQPSPHSRTTSKDNHSTSVSATAIATTASPQVRTGEAIGAGSGLEKKRRLLTWFDNADGFRSKVEFFTVDCTPEERVVIARERPEFIAEMRERQ